MIVSTRGRYALRVLIDMAEHDAHKEYIPLKEVAERQEISEKYLEAIVKLLVNEKILSGLRGKGGGYKLNKKPSELSVGEILTITEGGITVVSCLANTKEKCPRSKTCKTVAMWTKLDTMVSDYLNSIKLSDLIKKEK